MSNTLLSTLNNLARNFESGANFAELRCPPDVAQRLQDLFFEQGSDEAPERIADANTTEYRYPNFTLVVDPEMPPGTLLIS